MIANYMQNPYALKTVCRKFRDRIKIYKIKMIHNFIKYDKRAMLNSVKDTITELTINYIHDLHFESFVNLRSLTLIGCNDVSVLNCDIRELKLEFCKNIIGINSLPKLSILIAHNTNNLTIKNKNLKVVHVSNCVNTDLRHLDLEECAIVNCESLYYMDINIHKLITCAYKIDDDFSEKEQDIIDIVYLNNVKHLRCYGSTNYDSDEIINLKLETIAKCNNGYRYDPCECYRGIYTSKCINTLISYRYIDMVINTLWSNEIIIPSNKSTETYVDIFTELSKKRLIILKNDTADAIGKPDTISIINNEIIYIKQKDNDMIFLDLSESDD